MLLDLQWIVSKAEEALHSSIQHITDARSPLSAGSIHDYYSNGDYWWPNPNTADGLPYVRRDGQSNPDAFLLHRKSLRQFRSCVAHLAAGYQITQAKAYLDKLCEFVWQFLLDKHTKMNPHLLYAQAIPGVCSGRSIGLIDTLHIIDVAQALHMLQDQQGMNREVVLGAKQWFRDYLTWMTTHPYGLEEMQAENNHSVCWFVQVAVFSRFVEDSAITNFCREHYKEVLLPKQMDLDGSFPRELARTKPYGYSIFVLDNMAALCQILSTKEDDLWNFELADGRGIRKGFQFLYPYLLDRAQWPYSPDVMHFDAWPVAVPSLLFAGLGLQEPKYIKLWHALEKDPVNDEVRRNIGVRQPILWLDDQSRGWSGSSATTCRGDANA